MEELKKFKKNKMKLFMLIITLFMIFIISCKKNENLKEDVNKPVIIEIDSGSIDSQIVINSNILIDKKEKHSNGKSNN